MGFEASFAFGLPKTVADPTAVPAALADRPTFNTVEAVEDLLGSEHGAEGV